LIVDVAKGGPAEKAGIRKNDVVIAYRGKEIPDSSELQNDVAETPIGTEVRIMVLCSGKKEELTVKIGSLEESTKILSAEVKERLGVQVRSPNSSEVNKYGLSPDQGVVITWMDSKGPLKEADFEIGDMILAINNQPIESMESFIDMVSLLKPKQKISIIALDHRTGNTGTIQIVVQ
jgi:serine protease Do